MDWIITMVCTLSVDPPRDFYCKNTTLNSTARENEAPELLLGLASADLTAGTNSVFQSQQVSTFSPVSSLLVACLLAVTVVAGVVLGKGGRRRAYGRLSSKQEQEEDTSIVGAKHKTYTYESI